MAHNLTKTALAAQENFNLCKEKSIPYVTTDHFITAHSMVCINLSIDILEWHRAAVYQEDDTYLVGVCFLLATLYFVTVGIKGLTKKDGKPQTGISFASPSSSEFVMTAD